MTQIMDKIHKELQIWKSKALSPKLVPLQELKIILDQILSKTVGVTSAVVRAVGAQLDDQINTYNNFINHFNYRNFA